MLSVTTGDMLQHPAAYRQLWSGLMSDPGYGDLFLKNEQDLERVVGTCFVAPGTRNTRTRTRGNNAKHSAS